MRQILGTRAEALYSAEHTRRIEQDASTALPAHTLMARAGLSVARLARALAPHARRIWVACGPGNNGGDGLVAATHLHRWAQTRAVLPQVVVTHWGGAGAPEHPLPPDADNALQQARAAGVSFASAPPASFDLAIDAVFGTGRRRPTQAVVSDWVRQLRDTAQPVLCVDLPSAIDADTGAWTDRPAESSAPARGARHTLSLLTLKPGLFTGCGRDAAGQVWLDELQIRVPEQVAVTAWLAGQPAATRGDPERPHAQHKGSRGDVIVLGGQDMAVDGIGMTGAALLAARAALHAGAGRVYVGLLGPVSVSAAVRWDPVCPELMLRQPAALLDGDLLHHSTLVCGCGGGVSVAALLPQVLSRAPQVVLDADALNAIARDTGLQTLLRQRHARGWITVLTPHPLEAARLLGSSSAAVQADRLRAAQTLCAGLGAVCVLKGSGSVISAPEQTPWINPSGNAALASAGTGDVLAGMIGSALALPGCTPANALQRVAQAVFQHGWLADHWHAGSDALHPNQSGFSDTLSASRLAARVQPFASGNPNRRQQ